MFNYLLTLASVFDKAKYKYQFFYAKFRVSEHNNYILQKSFYCSTFSERLWPREYIYYSTLRLLIIPPMHLFHRYKTEPYESKTSGSIWSKQGISNKYFFEGLKLISLKSTQSARDYKNNEV